MSMDTPKSPTPQSLHGHTSREREHSRQGNDTEIQPVPGVSQVSELI